MVGYHPFGPVPGWELLTLHTPRQPTGTPTGPQHARTQPWAVLFKDANLCFSQTSKPDRGSKCEHIAAPWEYTMCGNSASQLCWWRSGKVEKGQRKVCLSAGGSRTLLRGAQAQGPARCCRCGQRAALTERGVTAVPAAIWDCQHRSRSSNTELQGCKGPAEPRQPVPCPRAGSGPGRPSLTADF